VREKCRIRFLGIFSIILLCIACTFRELQNDTFYILKLGEYITSHGIDLMDHYCWVTSLSYTYPHWLYDVVMYLVYAGFGYTGIYVSSIILFIILICSIYYIQLKVNSNEFLALFISLLSISFLFCFVTARAQLVTIILFIWQVYFIEKLILTGKNKYILFLTLISLLVANFHATIWLFCLILYLPFLVSAIVEKIYVFKFNKVSLKSKKDGKIIFEKIIYIKKIVISFLLSFLMGIFTPSRICYTYIFRVMMGNSQDYIMEHAPLIVIDHFNFIVLCLVLLLILIFTKTKIKLKEVFMLSGLILMSLMSQRHLVFFYTIGVLYLSVIACRCLNLRKDNTLNILYSFIVKNKIVYILFLMVVIIFSYFKFQKNSLENYISTKDYPVEAVSFLKENLDMKTIRLYNAYNYGSYLLFNDIPVFIDSRCDLYLSEFNGLDYSIFDDAMEIERTYEEKFEFYGVTHVLLNKKSLFYQIISRDSNYKIIYKDKNFVLFEGLNYEEGKN